MLKYKGAVITNPYFDETGSFPVNPLDYYGVEIEKAKEVQQAWSNFSKSAMELSEAWEGSTTATEDFVGINNKYPFDENFDDVIIRINRWFEDDKK